MEPYFNMLLADSRLTGLQFSGMQQPVEVARANVQLRLSEERQWGYDTPVSEGDSAKGGMDFSYASN